MQIKKTGYFSTTMKNKKYYEIDNDRVKGKLRYQERVLDEQTADQEINEYLLSKEEFDYEDNFDEISNKLK